MSWSNISNYEVGDLVKFAHIDKNNLYHQLTGLIIDTNPPIFSIVPIGANGKPLNILIDQIHCKIIQQQKDTTAT